MPLPSGFQLEEQPKIIGLPSGFQLEQPQIKGLPTGFQLEQPQTAQQPTTLTAPPEKESFSALRQVADVPLQVGKGAVSGIRMIADAFGAGSDTSKTLRGAENYLADLMSAQSKQDSQEIARIMKEAEDKGVLDQVKAAVKSVAVAPVDFLSNALGTAAPAILASLGATVLGPIAATGAAIATGATMGAGTIKGSIYDSVKEELAKTNMPPDQIEARAQLAQNYNGQNLDMILTGAAIGTIGATTGAEPAIARQMAKGILSKTAIKQELSKVQEEELKKAVMRGPIKQGAISGGTEFGTEFTQAGQEQLAQNIALQREGYDVPTMRGVIGQATLEGLAGLGLGSVAGGREALKAKDILDQREYIKSETERLTKEQADKEQKANQVVPPQQDVDTLLSSAINPIPEPKATVPIDADVKTVVDQLQEDYDGRQLQIDDKSHRNVPAAINANARIKATIDALNTGVPLEEAAKNLNDKQRQAFGLTPQKTVSTATTPAATVDPVLAATNYMAEIGDKPGNMPKLKQIVKALGIDVPGGEGFVARAKTAIQEHLATLGEQNVTKPDLTTTGAGNEIPSESGAVVTAGGVIPTLNGELAGNQDVSRISDGGENQQLDSLKDADPTHDEVINSEEVLASQTEQNKAAVEQNKLELPIYDENGTVTNEVDDISPDATLAFEDGQVWISGDKYDHSIDSLDLLPDSPIKQAILQKAKDEFNYEPEVTPTEVTPTEVTPTEVTPTEVTPTEVTPTEEVAPKTEEQVQDKINSFDQLRDFLTGKMSLAEGKGDAQNATKAEIENKTVKESKVIKWWSRSIQTVNASIFNFLHKNGTFQEGPPLTIKDAMVLGPMDEAYDLFDSINIKGAVEPEIKRILIERMTARNKEIESQREAMRSRMKEDGFKESDIKIALLPIKKVKYLQNEPLEFMTLKELVDLFEQNIGTKAKFDEGGDARIKLLQDRQVFIDSLSPKKEETFVNLTKAMFELEVKNFAYKGGTTSFDLRRASSNQLKGQIQKRINELRKEFAQKNNIDVEEITTDQSDAIEAQVIDEFALKTEQEEKAEQELLQEKLEVGNKPRATTAVKAEPVLEVDPKLQNKIEEEINGAGLLDDVLKLIKNYNGALFGKTIADTFIKRIKDFSKATIEFDNIKDDGQFDPETNILTLKGENGKYTGERSIIEVVLHETGHFSTDHVMDNPDAYIASLPAKERPAVKAAINRLKNNYKYAKNKLGDKFNIPTIKEFIAEVYSNPRFQRALADLDTGEPMTEKVMEEQTQIVGTKETKYTAEREREIPGPPKRPYVMPKESLFQRIVKNIANIFGFDITREMANKPGEAVTLKESIEDIARIISLPTADIRGTEISFSKTQPVGKKQAPFLKIEDVYGDNPAFELPEKVQKDRFRDVIKDMFTYQGIQKNITKFQNNRRMLLNLNKANIRAGINHDSGPDVNNIAMLVSTASSKGMNKFGSYVQRPYQNLQQAMVEFAKTDYIIKATEQVNAKRKAEGKKELTTVQFMNGVLHIYGQAFTDQERRLNMFAQSAPLSTDKNITINGKTISAADLRELILGNPVTKKAGMLDNPNLSEDQAKQLWQRLEQYVFTTDANGNKIPNAQYVVVGGSSPLGRTAIDFRNEAGNTQYNVTGFTYDETAKTLARYEKDVNKPILDKIFEATWKLNAIALELNKESYYVSKPAANWIAAYGYKHYVPLKGITNHNVLTQKGALNFNGTKLETELADTAIKSEGRFSVSNNPILQSMSEAIIASVRAGKGPNYTLAIKNSVYKSPKKIDGKDVDLNPNGQGHIKGKVIEHIPFAERSFDTIKSIRKENTVFHHNEDGSIDVIEIEDRAMLEAIRRPFKEQNKFVEMANMITSGLGQLHTRYNVNFAPLNFTRDALTNAWNIGAEIGPIKGAELITQIAYQVSSKNSLGKAWKVARAYKTPEFEKYKNSSDPMIRNMYELITEGGMVEYMESISLKSNLEKLDKELNKSNSRIVKSVEGLNTIIDSWTNMFEIASRAAAYGLLKEHYRDVEKLSPQDAKMRAADTTKNLANFEQVGEYGKTMGALYMFYRPSATGAVRALDALAPAMWNSLERAVKNAPEHIRNDPKALETFKKNYRFQQKAARQMVTALGGIGALAYIMSYMMSDTDDEDRNKTLTDDMGQWTRFWRLHIPGFDKPFQIPWGFGLGAFAAMGAQLMAVIFGQQSFMAALNNGATQIALDSFVPLPVSRMNIADNPAMWFIDSMSPSAIRPVVEFVANKNGLGQSIYNDASGRRMGDAYLGGDHVPETYKITTRFLAELTDGWIDWTPNSMYFLVNSYADGPGKLIDLTLNNYYFATGDRDFETKSNLPLLGSFIGSAPNVDTREFVSVEKQINEIRSRISMFKQNRPEFYALTYLPDHPFDPAIVKMYDQNIGKLNNLRHQSKIIIGAEHTPSERKSLLEMNRMQQNMVKHNMVEMFKAYGVEP